MKAEVEVYSLTYAELAILANRMGMKKIYGFSLNKVNELEKIDFLDVINKMVNKGMLTVEQEQFQIASPYKELILQMKHADKIMLITPKSEYLPIKCCYMKDTVLVSEISPVRENRLRFYYKEREEILEDLEEEGYLPQIIFNEDENENVHSEAEEEEETLLTAEEMLLDEKVNLVIQVLQNFTNKEIGWIAIYEEPLTYQIVHRIDQFMQKELYSLDKMKKQFQKL